MRNGCLVLIDGGPLPAKPSDGKRRIFSADDGTFFFSCPGCGATHTYHTDRTQGEPCWDTNYSDSFPSFYPSMRVCAQRGQCHFYVTDGRIAFEGDSTHALAGKTVELPEITLHG
jgi:Family of unknown function (DUF6527)